MTDKTPDDGCPYTDAELAVFNAKLAAHNWGGGPTPRLRRGDWARDAAIAARREAARAVRDAAALAAWRLA